jgi:hypothetical protein
MLRLLSLTALFFVLSFFSPVKSYAQDFLYLTPAPPEPTASVSAKETIIKNEKSVAEPEEATQKQAVVNLLNKRASGNLNLTNFLPYAELAAIKAGVPANTIILILLLPLLATIVVSFRYLIGLSGIGLLVPIALSVTLLATGVTPGFILIAAILLASIVSRFLLKKLRIMQMPKMALSMFVVAIFLVATLYASAAFNIFDVTNLSIFPILLFILLSDRITALFMERDIQETMLTTAVTLLLGILGFILLSLEYVRSLVLLYPELIFLLIPINILIGRYFGLRVTEYIKFQPVIKHGSK